ncbi:MAG: phosphatidate cytidylyltransferase [Halioglobus sp.]|nr:phosphatidate cytidylyltransferase [Halioglobus sp.]
MLKKRILTAIVAAPLLLVVLFVLPESAARLVIAALVLVGAWEWAAFAGLTGVFGRLAFVAVTAVLIAVLLLLVLPGESAVDAVFFVAMVWWAVALVWIFLYPTPVPHAVAAVAGMAVLIPAWLALDLVYRQAPGVLLFMLLIVWSADIGAYFAGKAFGRVKLAPQISPGKTWEGVLGGLLLVALAGGLGAHYFGRPVSVMLPFCIAIGLISVVGDLTVSIFKRSAGIKDSGRLFPGHGGLLDRIDGVTAAAPLFALGAHWAGL